MPTLRRLAETELMSFSLIQDLNSFTAKAADTPAIKPRWQLGYKLFTQSTTASLEPLNRSVITFLDQVLIKEAVQDGGWYIAIGQQDSGKHGQFIPLWLCEPF